MLTGVHTVYTVLSTHCSTHQQVHTQPIWTFATFDMDFCDEQVHLRFTVIYALILLLENITR